MFASGPEASSEHRKEYSLTRISDLVGPKRFDFNLTGNARCSLLLLRSGKILPDAEGASS
jgi:hypothetical protein